jgi:hypothetical protein
VRDLAQYFWRKRRIKLINWTWEIMMGKNTVVVLHSSEVSSGCHRSQFAHTSVSIRKSEREVTMKYRTASEEDIQKLKFQADLSCLHDNSHFPKSFPQKSSSF